jgi:acyl-CoA thioesterase FadM
MGSPFIHEIRVTWGDCDPAKIAYTGRLPAMALDAINAWWEEHLGGDGWFQMEIDRNVGTPFVHLSLDFRSPVTPRHRLQCAVWPQALGDKSITFRVDAHQDGVRCFEGTFVCVFIIADQFKSQVVPADIRAIVEPLIRAA